MIFLGISWELLRVCVLKLVDSMYSKYEWLIVHSKHKSLECLIWPFAKISTGYGQFRRNGTRVYAHRIMCELAHGKCPTNKKEAVHTCRNTSCVNPNHLRWATHIENMQDRTLHGTHYTFPKGTEHPVYKQMLARWKDTNN